MTPDELADQMDGIDDELAGAEETLPALEAHAWALLVAIEQHQQAPPGMNPISDMAARLHRLDGIVALARQIESETACWPNCWSALADVERALLAQEESEVDFRPCTGNSNRDWIYAASQHGHGNAILSMPRVGEPVTERRYMAEPPPRPEPPPDPPKMRCVDGLLTPHRRAAKSVMPKNDSIARTMAALDDEDGDLDDEFN